MAASTGCEAGALVGRGEDGAGRCRGRIPGTHLHDDHVRFPVVKRADRGSGRGCDRHLDDDALDHPGNRAVASAEDWTMRASKCLGSPTQPAIGRPTLVWRRHAGEHCKKPAIDRWEVERLKGQRLAGTICAHPLRGHRASTTMTCPRSGPISSPWNGHGHCAYRARAMARTTMIWAWSRLWRSPTMVGRTAAFREHVPLFAGQRDLDDEGKEGRANRAVVSCWRARAALCWGRLKHSAIPHSWRSKAPLIFRNTPQWFISMETNDLREKR